MKLLILLFTVAMALAVPVEQYNADNDNIDVEAIVNSEETIKAFYGCFIESSPCNNVQSAFKKDLAEAVQEACAKCTPAQKHILRRFLEVLKDKYQPEYKGFQNKFDPEAKYFTNLEAAIAGA